MHESTTKHDEVKAIQRSWYDLKPGDVIFFATGWYEVFDACPVAANKMVIKLAIGPTRIETHCIRVNVGSQVTCRI